MILLIWCSDLKILYLSLEGKYIELNTMEIEEIYQSADKLFDEGKYKDVIKTISNCPEEKYTRQIAGLLIAAYNNTNQFDNALACLEKFRDLYQDKMRAWHYFSVYAFIGKKECIRAFEDIEAGFKACDEDKKSGILDDKEYQSEVGDFYRLMSRCEKVQNEMDKNLGHIRELDKVKSPYEIVKEDNEIIFKFDRDRSLDWKTIAWSGEKKCWVVAMKRNITNNTYVVEYVLLDESFNIIEVYRESEGVNPSFLLAPSGEIWVVMSATKEGYPDSSDVTIPLFNRARISKPVVKRDTGMDYFFLDGQTQGYIVDFWGRGKETKLIQNVYDKSGLYKDRKGKALKDIYGGIITSIGKRAYLSYKENLYEISDKLGTEMIGIFTEEKEVLSFVIDRDDKVTTYIRLHENMKDIYFVKYTNDGKVLSQELVYASDTRVNTMDIQSLQDGSQKIQFVAKGVNIIGYREGEYFVYEGELGDHTGMIKFGTLIIQKSRAEEKYLKIIEIPEERYKSL